jgi:hypothetical protein
MYMVKRAAFLMSATGRLAIGVLLVAVARIVCRMEIHGLERVRRDPVTYMAISHKRDLDTFGPVFPILRARGWHALIHDVRFAMRGDAFTPHFLSRLVTHPRWLSWLLRPVSVGALLRGIGLYPLNDLRVRPAEEWVCEHLQTEGDAVVGNALSSEFVQYLSANSNISTLLLEQQSLSSLLLWRYHTPMQVYWGSEIFIGSARRHAEQRVIARARRELDNVAAWMHEGGSLYSSPEGKLSPDGTLSRISGGFHRMLRGAPDGTSVIPVAIIYDFMTTKRLRMFVEVAPPIPNVTHLTRAQLDLTLRRAWRRGMRFTCTQLASGFLVKTADAESTSSFTLDDLVQAVMQQAAALDREGRLIDNRLLLPRQARKLAGDYLKFAERHRLVQHDDNGSWTLLDTRQAIDVRPGDVGYPVAPLTYAWNELQDLLGANLSSVDLRGSDKPDKEIAG